MKRDPLLGTTIDGQYRIESLLGLGGMGAVYRATQLAVDRPVALKVLRTMDAYSDEQLLERFRREAMATSRLRHPNTVQVIDFGQTDAGMLYMVLELLEGAPLSDVIASGGPMPPDRVASIGRQIAKSLTEAHSLGIVHRDLKPDNIFICNYHGEADFAKVMDFGIARVLTVDNGMTRTGMMIGTPKYMAPEQAMARKVGPQADIYALGIMLFEMLSGQPPFVADSGMALALAHIHEEIPPLDFDGLPEPIAQGWRGLVTAMVAKDPTARPGRAADVAQWLKSLEIDTRRHFDDEHRRTGLHPHARWHRPQDPVATMRTAATPVPGSTPSPARPLRGDGSVTPGHSPAAFRPHATMTLQAPSITAERRPRRRRRRVNALLWLSLAFMLAGGIVAAMLLQPIKRSNVQPKPPTQATEGRPPSGTIP